MFEILGFEMVGLLMSPLMVTDPVSPPGTAVPVALVSSATLTRMVACGSVEVTKALREELESAGTWMAICVKGNVKPTTGN